MKRSSYYRIARFAVLLGQHKAVLNLCHAYVFVCSLIITLRLLPYFHTWDYRIFKHELRDSYDWGLAILEIQLGALTTNH